MARGQQNSGTGAAVAIGGWITVSKRNRGWLLLIAVAGALFGGWFAILLGDPVRLLVLQLAGPGVPSWLTYLLTCAIAFALIIPALLVRSSGSVQVESGGDRLRLGRRVITAGELHRAYRELDRAIPGRYLLRLSIPGVADPRIEIASASRMVLGREALDALIALVERSGIEPDPAVRPVPADGAELPDEQQRFLAELDRRLGMLETRSFSRETLLAALVQARDRAESGLGDPGLELIKALGHRGDAPAPPGTVASTAPPAPAHRPSPRTIGPAYTAAVADVAGWLTEHGATVPDARTWRSRAGVALIVAGIAGPPLIFVWTAVFGLDLLFTLSWVVGFEAGFLLGILAGFVLVLAPPFLIWSGLMLRARDRLERFDRLRGVALTLRASGVRPTAAVIEFFRPNTPWTRYLGAMVWYWAGLVVAGLSMTIGAVIMATAAGSIGSLGQPPPMPLGLALIPLALASAAGTVWLFVRLVHHIAWSPVRWAREQVLWTALVEGPGVLGASGRSDSSSTVESAG